MNGSFVIAQWFMLYVLSVPQAELAEGTTVEAYDREFVFFAEEVGRCDRTIKKHVVVGIKEVLRKSWNAVQVVFDYDRVEARQCFGG